MRALAARYGASPLHLILHVALLSAFAWVVLSVADARAASNIALWFVLAIVLHDLALLPFYSAIDRVLRHGEPSGAVNHIRVPAALSAVLLLLFFPPILGLNEGSFERVAGVAPHGYLMRWLLLTAALFTASSLLYVVRSRRRAAAVHSAS